MLTDPIRKAAMRMGLMLLIESPESHTKRGQVDNDGHLVKKGFYTPLPRSFVKTR
jgi:hypothetical protein